MKTTRILSFLLAVSLIALYVAGDGGREAAAQPFKSDSPSITAADDQVLLSAEVRLLAKPVDGKNALLLVRILPGPGQPPAAITYPLDDAAAVLNDTASGGDEKAGDQIYSGRIVFDVETFKRKLAATLPRLDARKLSPLDVRTARFGAPPSARMATTVTPARTIANVRAGIASLEQLRGAPDADISLMTVELVRGQASARLFGQPVPMAAFANSGPVWWGDILYNLSLMITDTSVVEDPTRTYDLCGGINGSGTGTPNGAWSFKHLMTEMANTPATGIPTAKFVEHWLSLFATPQEANSYIALALGTPGNNFVTKVRDHWARLSNGDLDLDKAPFRLLAIVSRTDLGPLPGGYGGANAGEARLVFGALDPNNACGPPLNATVIFEYAVHKASCADKKAWIQKWYDLSYSNQFNTDLEALTKTFVDRGADPSQIPNHSTISQVRLDDFIASTSPWSLREARLESGTDVTSGWLDLVTVKQTPDWNTFHGGNAELAAYVAGHVTAINANAYTVPPTTSQGTPFLGAEAPYDFFGRSWVPSTPPNGPEWRNFSRGTCMGCHTIEGTGESPNRNLDAHVFPRSQGAPAQLSHFLTDLDLNTPMFFGDLARRQVAMADALNASCLVFPIAANALHMTH